MEKIAGKGAHTLDRTNIPGCAYSMPQVASVGLTEQAAKGKGLKIKVGRFPYQGNGKAIALMNLKDLSKPFLMRKPVSCWVPT